MDHLYLSLKGEIVLSSAAKTDIHKYKQQKRGFHRG